MPEQARAPARRSRVGTIRRLCAAALSLGVATTITACQQGIEGAGRRVDAPGVPVALVGVEGAPEALQGQVTDAVVAQARARHIDLVEGSEKPRFRLKGYLTAYSAESGQTALAFVWDVFDASQKRAQRISTTALAPGHGADPWAQVGEAQIDAVASRSMNEVAAFLAGGAAGGGAMALSPQ